MAFGHSHAVRRIALEVELDDDRRLVADDQPSCPGSDRDDGRSGDAPHAAVREADVDAAAREKPTCACMHWSVWTSGFMFVDQRKPTG